MHLGSCKNERAKQRNISEHSENKSIFYIVLIVGFGTCVSVFDWQYVPCFKYKLMEWSHG